MSIIGIKETDIRNVNPKLDSHGTIAQAEKPILVPIKHLIGELIVIYSQYTQNSCRMNIYLWNLIEPISTF